MYTISDVITDYKYLSFVFLASGHCYAVNGGSPVNLDDVVMSASTASLSDIEDHLVMETKLTIIEILKVLFSAFYLL